MSVCRQGRLGRDLQCTVAQHESLASRQAGNEQQ